MDIEGMLEPIIWIGAIVFAVVWLREEKRSGWKTLKGLIRR